MSRADRNLQKQIEQLFENAKVSAQRLFDLHDRLTQVEAELAAIKKSEKKTESGIILI